MPEFSLQESQPQTICGRLRKAHASAHSCPPIIADKWTTEVQRSCGSTGAYRRAKGVCGLHDEGQDLSRESPKSHADTSVMEKREGHACSNEISTSIEPLACFAPDEVFRCTVACHVPAMLMNNVSFMP